MTRVSKTYRAGADPRSDRDLLEAAGADLEAFGELVRRHQDFVFGAVMRVVKDPVMAEDVAQDTFLRAYRSRATFRGEAAVRSWLYRIGTNLALNAVTRRREFPHAELPEQPTFFGPLAMLEQAETRQQVRTAIDRLPDGLRQPLVLREFEELSYREISDRMELPLNTVRTRILRARRALRTEMEGSL